MLWKKGWKETRLRMLLLILATLALGLVASPREGRKSQASLNGVDAMTLFGASVLGAVMLAGAGIKTQAGGFRPSKGLHGSMIYTLSLPVTRTRIFGVRVAFGLAETFAIHVFAGCIAWLTQPQLRVTGHPVRRLYAEPCRFFLRRDGVFAGCVLRELPRRSVSDLGNDCHGGGNNRFGESRFFAPVLRTFSGAVSGISAEHA